MHDHWSNLNLNGLLVIRQIDNTSQGEWNRNAIEWNATEWTNKIKCALPFRHLLRIKGYMSSLLLSVCARSHLQTCQIEECLAIETKKINVNEIGALSVKLSSK